MVFDTERKEIETPLIERVDDRPDDPAKVPEWSLYNEDEFSPYALAEGNPRSVAALKVKGGPFARREKRGGATMVPAYFYGAIGCNGSFSKEDVHAPLQLSKKDYQKREYTPDEAIVIIGGKSGSSRIFGVSSWEARVVGHALMGEAGCREAALNYLTEQGYDVGASGSSVSSSQRTNASRPGATSGEPRKIWPARANPRSDAEALQQKAEQEGIEQLSYPQVRDIACRHLHQGWKPTWEWFEEQYGSSFDPAETWNRLRDIVEEETFDEYEHVDVPNKPT